MHYILLGLVGLDIILDIIFITVLIFFERKDVSSTWAWLLILLFLPFIGAVLYILMGQGISKDKRFRKKYLDDTFKNSYFKSMKNDQNYNTSSELNKDVILMNYKNCNSLYTRNNTVDFIFEGKELYEDMLSELKKAEKYIHMQYYIFRSDSWGSKLLDELCIKGQSGIEVRLQIDGMGNFISKEYLNKLKLSNVKVEVFFPSIFKKINLRANYRNHRKFLLIDGKFGYLGGFNIGKEYVGEGHLGYWRDCNLKISGEALNDLEERFLLDWTFTSKECLNASYKKYFNYETEALAEHRVPMQIVSSGPDLEKNNIKNSYMKIINKATKRICIQTPYLIPDTSILDSLKIAALSGVQVDIMLPGSPDHFFIPWVSNTYIGILLDYGVNIHLYQRGFIHSKTMVVDSNICSVGTANMDVRSFSLNFETNAIIYSCNKSQELEDKFDEDLKDCRLLTKETFNKRSKKTKFLESIFRLFSNIM
ncbi:cardiolipin synthase [uncultured Clostridium sp.]|jgi:cardiolipin synthase|uniref:cardiolipin synthase n=1 Tax=uncultured Clostridium sp. TaxID=59620 RepID=UPI0026394F8E|nr:cardiolipin synthase [uncultured Clostridium sp.]